MSPTDPPIGKTWAAQEYEVGREKIREYASAIGSSAPIHFDPDAAREAGFDAVVAPPTFAAVYVARPLAGALFDPEVGVFDPQAGLAGYRFVQRGQRWEWGVPVQSGDVITTEASLAGGEERGGAIYRTFASTSHNQRGEVVLRGTYDGVVPAPKSTTPRGPGAETTGPGASRRDTAPERTQREGAAPKPTTPRDHGAETTRPGAFRRDTAPERTQREGARDDGEIWDGTWPPAPGAVLPEFTFTPDKYAPVRYAGASGDFTPFHLDPELARAVGLDGVILHGLYTFAQLARGVLAPFADDPRALRSLAARFRRPAFPERELTVTGTFATPPPDPAPAAPATLACAVSQTGKEVLSEGIAELLPLPATKTK